MSVVLIMLTLRGLWSFRWRSTNCSLPVYAIVNFSGEILCTPLTLAMIIPSKLPCCSLHNNYHLLPNLLFSSRPGQRSWGARPGHTRSLAHFSEGMERQGNGMVGPVAEIGA